MSLWVKVCANTSLADAMLAAESGADAVGFVFAESPRRVTVEQVETITPGLPGSVEKIGVFVDSSFEEIEVAVRGSWADGGAASLGDGGSLSGSAAGEVRPGVADPAGTPR